MSGLMVPDPPQPFSPEFYTHPVGELIFRVFSNVRTASTFNPTGPRGAARFSFFGEPPVPVLYGAQSDIAAICETLLHEIPASGGTLQRGQYESKVLGAITTTRPMRLASFMGTGLRRLGIEDRDLTDTEAVHYRRTVSWAEAAHAAGLDGIVWMSRRCNTDRAYVLFGDRVVEGDLLVANDVGRVFAAGPDLDWLIDLCAPHRVEVLSE
ncbi:hypothetical protein BH09ACT10_BH09ACT10_04470 [soil metagenome]